MIFDDIQEVKRCVYDCYTLPATASEGVDFLHQIMEDERDRLKTSFASELSSNETRQPIIGSSETLKKELPFVLLRTNIPSGGARFESRHIDRARLVLKAFCSAWEDMNPGAGIETLDVHTLQNTPIICLILHSIGKLEIIDTFVAFKIDDEELPFANDCLPAFMSDENIKSKFATHQYRAPPRWNEGDHIIFRDDELLPLRLICDHGYGGYGVVDQVQDIYTFEKYARKQAQQAHQAKKAKKVKQGQSRARSQLENEAKALEKLGKHHHIVQFGKTYEKGLDYGMLIKPPAVSDLFYLLASPRDVQESREFLLRAFGCLSLSLEYIHERRVRHKDINPKNILFTEPGYGQNEKKCIWADFGNAHLYERNQDATYEAAVYTEAYAAPEVGIKFFPHTKSSDVFSLGCVFIDILSVLVAEGGVAFLFEEGISFPTKLKRIYDYVKRHLNNEPHREKLLPLVPLLKLSEDMTRTFSPLRPSIESVASRLDRLSSKDKENKYFCNECLGLLLERERKRII
jgi:hypothetical protein